MILPRIVVDFSQGLQEWDGFGVNYVEACQTRDYDANPQEYGGFSVLSPEKQHEIIQLTFGEDGLKPGVVKMFLDCWHQAPPGEHYNFSPDVIDPAVYDHDKTTRWMRKFVQGGYELTRQRGDTLEIITTLYGPPAWMTQQKFVRGRDIDPKYKTEVAKYMIAWAKHLRDVENLPVKYISVHNEGEDWIRWDLEGETAGSSDHDYNMYWSPELVVDFLRFMPQMLAAQGMHDVSVTPGECTGWYRFHEWGYADSIASDQNAVQQMGLITSHGFKGGDHTGEWFNDWRSAGVDVIRAKRPDLHTWVTSTSWSQMDVFFIDEMRHNIYSAKVNAIIPWACIQLQGHWVGGDPNPGTAFRVYDDGTYEVTKGYYFYKQISRAGQSGMDVCHAVANDRQIGMIAFGRNNTKNPDTFLILNMSGEERQLTVQVKGSSSNTFEGFCTSETHNYSAAGQVSLEDGMLHITVPAHSVTTFFGCE